MASLHADEVNLEEKTVRRLIDHQFPAWEHLPLSPAGEGTDNRMLRLGDDLVVRLPRTSGTAADLAKEQRWLPRLAPHLPLSIPEPVAIGRPDESDACRSLEGLHLDLDRLHSIWQAAMELDQPRQAHTWMHTDLKPSNLLVRNSVLVGVVDFGGLSVGDPTCEHAATWDLPAEARHAYAEELGLDKRTRLRARAWALAIAVSGVPYYWSSWPDFAQECVRRLQRILRDTDDV